MTHHFAPGFSQCLRVSGAPSKPVLVCWGGCLCGEYNDRAMFYLLKTEPSVYGFADLQKEQSTIWDGVTNPVAVKNLRNMQKGDKLVIYHTGDEKRAAG